LKKRIKRSVLVKSQQQDDEQMEMGMTSWWGCGGDGDAGHGDGVEMGKEMWEWGGDGDEFFYCVVLYHGLFPFSSPCLQGVPAAIPVLVGEGFIGISTVVQCKLQNAMKLNAHRCTEAACSTSATEWRCDISRSSAVGRRLSGIDTRPAENVQRIFCASRRFSTTRCKRRRKPTPGQPLIRPV